jgi:hypothetical protein
LVDPAGIGNKLFRALIMVIHGNGTTTLDAQLNQRMPSALAFREVQSGARVTFNRVPLGSSEQNNNDSKRSGRKRHPASC